MHDGSRFSFFADFLDKACRIKSSMVFHAGFTFIAYSPGSSSYEAQDTWSQACYWHRLRHQKTKVASSQGAEYRPKRGSHSHGVSKLRKDGCQRLPPVLVLSHVLACTSELRGAHLLMREAEAVHQEGLATGLRVRAAGSATCNSWARDARSC